MVSRRAPFLGHRCLWPYTACLFGRFVRIQMLSHGEGWFYHCTSKGSWVVSPSSTKKMPARQQPHQCHVHPGNVLQHGAGGQKCWKHVWAWDLHGRVVPGRYESSVTKPGGLELWTWGSVHPATSFLGDIPLTFSRDSHSQVSNLEKKACWWTGQTHVAAPLRHIL